MSDELLSIAPTNSTGHRTWENQHHNNVFLLVAFFGVFFSIIWYTHENTTFQISVPTTGLKFDRDRHNLVRYKELMSITGKYPLKYDTCLACTLIYELFEYGCCLHLQGGCISTLKMETGSSSEVLETITEPQDLTRKGWSRLIWRYAVIISKRESAMPGLFHFRGCCFFRLQKVQCGNTFIKNLDGKTSYLCG